MVRSAALSGFSELARSLGLAPERLARQAGVPLRALASPDVMVPAHASYRLMERAAADSGVPDLGLRLAQPRGLSHLGVLGLLARDEKDVRSALRRIISGMTLHSTCISMDLQEYGDVALHTLALLPDGEPEIRQSTEAAMGLLMQILVHLLGAEWKPVRVQFTHARGASERAYRACFRCPIEFNAGFSAIVLRRADLDRPVPGADRGFQRFAPPGATLDAHRPHLSPERVRQAILLLIPTGRCTSVAVAQQLGVHRRTLHRHLSAEGVDFSELLHTLRGELASDHLAAGLLSVSQIAELTGFNSVSAFTRWFTNRVGVSPTRWRGPVRTRHLGPPHAAPGGPAPPRHEGAV